MQLKLKSVIASAVLSTVLVSSAYAVEPGQKVDNFRLVDQHGQ
jgi:hypothetical protein